MSTRQGARKTVKAEVVSMAPDVCKTPVGGPPVPYNITAKLDPALDVSPNVRFTKCPVFTFKSYATMVVGDEPGLGKGVKSFTVGDKAEPITKSSTVRINGNWAVRHDDLFQMNNKNTVGKLVYIEGSPVGESSGESLSAGGASENTLSLLNSNGILGKLTGIGKNMAMTAIMGGDPMDTLKAMTDPKNLVKNYLQQSLGGLMQDVGPIGSMIGKQLLNDNVLDDIVNGRNPMDSLKASLSPENILKVQAGSFLQQTGPLGSSIGGFVLNNLPLGKSGAKTEGNNPKSIKNPLADSQLTSNLLKQADIGPKELGSLLDEGSNSPYVSNLNKMNFADAHADILANKMANKTDFSPSLASSSKNMKLNEALSDSRKLLLNMGRGYENLIKYPSMPPSIDWQALFK